jgi:hypothetical protein
LRPDSAESDSSPADDTCTLCILGYTFCRKILKIILKF